MGGYCLWRTNLLRPSLMPGHHSGRNIFRFSSCLDIHPRIGVIQHQVGTLVSLSSGEHDLYLDSFFFHNIDEFFNLLEPLFRRNRIESLA